MKDMAVVIGVTDLQNSYLSTENMLKYTRVVIMVEAMKYLLSGEEH
jgi:hypothetical protein